MQKKLHTHCQTKKLHLFETAKDCFSTMVQCGKTENIKTHITSEAWNVLLFWWCLWYYMLLNEKVAITKTVLRKSTRRHYTSSGYATGHWQSFLPCKQSCSLRNILTFMCTFGCLQLRLANAEIVWARSFVPLLFVWYKAHCRQWFLRD